MIVKTIQILLIYVAASLVLKKENKKRNVKFNNKDKISDFKIYPNVLFIHYPPKY